MDRYTLNQLGYTLEAQLVQRRTPGLKSETWATPPVEDETMNEYVARRVLHCQLTGKSEEVIVCFGIPRQESDYFTCEYEISVAGESETYQIIGKDSVHALQLAMFMVGSALQSIQGASDWSWDDEPHTGFPTSLDQPILGLRT